MLLHALACVAPEADLAALDPSADVREELDLDSMDVLRFATLLHETLGVDVHERPRPASQRDRLRDRG